MPDQADDLTAERAASGKSKRLAAHELLREIVGIIPMQPEQRCRRIDLLLDYAKAARREALREAARQTCMYCSGNARGYTLGVAGPNSAGNYTHEVPEDSWAKEGVLCKATSIWSLIYYEDRLTSEGA